MNKRKMGSIILSSVIVISVLSLLLECRIYFRKFELPGDIYEYKYDDVEYQILEGKETACIVGSKETIYAVKRGKEWKLPFNESSTAKYIEDGDDAMICVYEYNKSDDYYIIIYLKNKNVMVSDNLDSNFILVNKECYRACVTNPDNDYVIYVNGKEYSVFD